MYKEKLVIVYFAKECDTEKASVKIFAKFLSLLAKLLLASANKIDGILSLARQQKQ